MEIVRQEVLKEKPTHEYTVSLETRSVSFIKYRVVKSIYADGDELTERVLWRHAVTYYTPNRDQVLREHFDEVTANYLSTYLWEGYVPPAP